MENSGDSDTGPTGTSNRSKVARVLSKYGVTDFGDEMEIRWQGDAAERSSLRDLADTLNQKLLRIAMEDAGMDVLDGEAENVYRLLTDDDVTSGAVTDARRRLERAGVDVDQLQEDFVSRQAIHTYLTKVREATFRQTETDPISSKATTIHQMRDRTSTITQSKLASLAESDHISINSPRVLVDIQVLCEECGQQYSIDEFLSERSCECTSD